MNNQQIDALNAALQVGEAFPIKPTSIVQYQSRGRVIVLAEGDAWTCCQQLADPLSAVVVLKAAPGRYTSQQPEIIPLGSRKIQVSGYLGAFEVSLVDALGNGDTLQGDIVLDLQAVPSVHAELMPPGYLTVSPDELDETDIEATLLEMVGEFEKPRYFNYDPSICAHGVNGNTVCSACIDACPADAIVSVGDKIEVNPQLCQGGGTCATACPSGAIRYAYPGADDTGNRIRLMLKTFREQGGEAPIVVFHQADNVPEELQQQQPTALMIAVEEIASVGMELCISSLVYGASQVLLVVNDGTPKSSLEQLHQQLGWLQAVLEGTGVDAERVSIVQHGDDFHALPAEPERVIAEYAMPVGKRQALFQAIDHLYQHAARTRELVSLPAGAPFGTATIDDKSCTLCMACVSACPGKALQDGSNRDMPEVFFIESNCLQCGACTSTCPEQAIFISPRLVLDREKRNRARMLNQDSPFNCITCGKPFAPTSAIHKMLFKLKDHHMFQTGRALDRLKMCENCRVADIVQDPDAMDGNFDPLVSNRAKSLP